MSEYTINLATILFIVFTIYMVFMYGKTIVTRKNRAEHREKRSEMTKLRHIPVKSIEEQKRFLDLKRPKGKPFDWSLKNVSRILLRIAIFLTVIITSKRLWAAHVQYNFALWHVILYALLLPIIINMILRKFGLEQDDILIFFR